MARLTPRGGALVLVALLVVAPAAMTAATADTDNGPGQLGAQSGFGSTVSYYYAGHDDGTVDELYQSNGTVANSKNVCGTQIRDAFKWSNGTDSGVYVACGTNITKYTTGFNRLYEKNVTATGGELQFLFIKNDYIYTGDKDGYVYKLESNGTEVWNYTKDLGEAGRHATIGPDHLFVPDYSGGTIHKITLNGSQVWNKTGSSDRVTEIEYDNGTVYYSTRSDKKIVAASASDLSEQWNTSFSYNTAHIEAFGDNVFVGIIDTIGGAHYFKKLDKETGTETNSILLADNGLWLEQTPDGNLLASVDGGRLYKYDTSFNTLWKTTDSSDWKALAPITAQVKYAGSSITGVVETETNTPIADAAVIVRQNGNVIASRSTNSLGEYEIGVDAGTYEVTADKKGYHSKTKTVSVADGAVATEDYTLVELTRKIELDVKPLMEHASSQPYTVYYYESDNKTGTIDRTDVTASANVSSGNTSVVTVDETEFVLRSTPDEDLNARVVLSANYTRNNTTYQTTQNVTVANVTVENLELLPGAHRAAAIAGDDAMFFLIIGMLTAIAFTRLASSFAGISGLTLVVVVGWVGGGIGDGLAMVGVFTGVFIGLNLAANIDYAVRRA